MKNDRWDPDKGKEVEIIDNRGKFGVMAWEEAKKAGGLACSPSQLSDLFKKEENEMLTREELLERVEGYFKGCITIRADDLTGELNYIWKRNPTKSGLALAIGVTPSTLIEYVNGITRKGHIYDQIPKTCRKVDTADFDILRKSYALIEDFYEQKLGDNRNNAGVIFWLNNRENSRWSNEQEFKFTDARTEERKALTAADLPKLSGAEKSIGLLPRLDSEEE